MKTYMKFYLLFMFLFFSIKSQAVDNDLGISIKINDAGYWSVHKTNQGYSLRFENLKGVIYDNESLIDPDFNTSDLLLDRTSENLTSLVMSYPRDTYSFSFSSEDEPRMLSACKQTILPAIDASQAAMVIVLCAKDSTLKDEKFENLTAEKVFNPNELYLSEKTKVAIETPRSFLFNDDHTQIKNKPYLIKGDIVDVLEYKDSMLKIKYKTKSKSIIGWIKFSDVL